MIEFEIKVLNRCVELFMATPETASKIYKLYVANLPISLRGQCALWHGFKRIEPTSSSLGKCIDELQAEWATLLTQEHKFSYTHQFTFESEVLEGLDPIVFLSIEHFDKPWEDQALVAAITKAHDDAAVAHKAKLDAFDKRVEIVADWFDTTPENLWHWITNGKGDL